MMRKIDDKLMLHSENAYSDHYFKFCMCEADSSLSKIGQSVEERFKKETKKIFQLTSNCDGRKRRQPVKKTGSKRPEQDCAIWLISLMASKVGGQ